MSELFFHNPTHIGTISISTTQIDKELPFEFSEPVVIEQSSVKIKYLQTLVKEYNIDGGLIIDPDNTKVTLTLKGPDFSDYVGKILKATCTFIEAGNVEIEFDLKIYQGNE